MAGTFLTTILRRRARLEAAIEAAIAELDALDGDADFEPDEDLEDDELEPDVTDEPHDWDELEDCILDAGHGFSPGFDGSGETLAREHLARLSNINRRYRRAA